MSVPQSPAPPARPVEAGSCPAHSDADHTPPTGRPRGLEDLPEIPDPRTAAPADARALSKVLFSRLDSLEEGTPGYSYVRGTLIELNLALVKFVAGRFHARSESVEDIIQVGTIGLIKAIDRFTPERHVEFSTYAIPTIAGEIKRYFRDTGWAVRVPRRLQEMRLHLAKATDALEQELEHTPTVGELAECLGVGEEAVTEGLEARNAYTTSSLDAQAQADATESAISDRFGYEDPGMEAVENLESLKPLIARLPERERTILSLRFVGDMTQAQIGEEVGISQMHVSRLLSHALGVLHEGLLDEE